MRGIPDQAVQVPRIPRTIIGINNQVNGNEIGESGLTVISHDSKSRYPPTMMKTIMVTTRIQ